MCVCVCVCESWWMGGWERACVRVFVCARTHCSVDSRILGIPHVKTKTFS